MKVSIENLGVIKEAEFEIGDLTIICGENNTGKTYLTHATYGFLEFLPSIFFRTRKEIIDKLVNGDRVTLQLSDYRRTLNRKLKNLSKEYSRELGGIFAGSESQFEDADFCFQFDIKADSPPVSIPVSKFMLNKDYILDFNFRVPSLNKDELILQITPSASSVLEEKPDRYIVEREISRKIRDALLIKVPRTFISSAERTGAAIFQRELDFAKNRLWELMDENGSKPRLSLALLRTEFGGIYPLSIRRNIDFIRWWPNVAHEKSDLLKKHPEIFKDFSDIIGGDLRISKEGIITFTPASNKSVKLSLLESSGSVRSLLDVNFYLLHHAKPSVHHAKPGDILIIDEPELNLHPENQRRVARLFARLVNAGIRVFISTHSDYIIKELNTLIMLNDDEGRLKKFAEKEGYDDAEFLRPDQIKAYMTRPLKTKSSGAKRLEKYQTLVPMEINDARGIRAESFDTTIIDMNRIQDEIIWGDHE